MDKDSVIMPRKLTAENGAKSLLMGEFYESTEVTCGVCGGQGYEDEDFEDTCSLCHGNGEVVRKVPVSWTTIKAIYEKAMEHLSTDVHGPADYWKANHLAGNERIAALEAEQLDLAMMIMRLARKLRTAEPAGKSELSDQAIELLRRYGIEGSPLRNSTPPATQENPHE